MKNAPPIIGAIIALAAAAVTALSLTLWELLPEVADTGRALYHLLWGLCQHSFRPGRVELLTIVALATAGLLVLIAERTVRHFYGRVRHTQTVTAALLGRRCAQRLSVPPAIAQQCLPMQRVDIVEHPAAFAFCYGLVRPRICVSTGLLDILTPREMGAVLLHEWHHGVRRDPLVILVAGALVHGVFFLPVLRDLLLRYEAVKEFDADDFVVRIMGERVSVAAALYKVLTSRFARPEFGNAAVGALSVDERRIERLLDAPAANAPPLVASRATVSGFVLASAGMLLAVSMIASAQPLLHACRL